MIEIPVSIEKADIPVLGEVKGHTNAATIEVGGVTLDRCALAFLGFVGLKNIATGKWDGVLRFIEPANAVTYKSAQACDFNQWINPEPAPAAYMEDDEQ